MSQDHQEGVVGRGAFLGADARRVIAFEQEALAQLKDNLPEKHQQLLSFLSAAPGKIVFSGIGKSGHVARMLAATFPSVGLPAFFASRRSIAW